MEDQLSSRSGFRISSRLVLGLLIALAGGLLLLDNLGMVDAWTYFRFWPVALILLGVSKIVQKQGAGFGIVLVGIGTWLLLDNLDYADFDGDLIFPGLVLLLGLSLIWKELTKGSRRLRGTNPRDEVDSFVMMGAMKHTLTTQAFQGGTATAIMGGVEIDLRQAALAGNRAYLDTFTWWGGVDVYVPEGWEVVFQGVPIIGGFDDKTRQVLGEDPPQLIITGYAIMGGVEVRNAPAKEE